MIDKLAFPHSDDQYGEGGGERERQNERTDIVREGECPSMFIFGNKLTTISNFPLYYTRTITAATLNNFKLLNTEYLYTLFSANFTSSVGRHVTEQWAHVFNFYNNTHIPLK